MSRFYHLVLCAALALLVAGTASAQITITKADVEAGFFNSVRTEYGHQYMFGSFPAINLGSASGSTQTFDFTGAPAGDMWRDTSATTYVPAAGAPGASEFPGANIASVVETSFGEGAVITFVTFYSLEDDGLYGLGSYAHQYFPPFLDTTAVSKFMPKRLFLPLPLTYGTSRTFTDTSINDASSGEYEVRTRVFTCNAFGSITFPATAAIPLLKGAGSELCLRVQTDDIVNVFDGTDAFIMHARNREIDFIGASTTFLALSMEDSNYAGGAGAVMSRSLDMKTGTTGVQPLPAAVPEEFSLSQNYPNPFNPTTKITFAIPAEDVVTLKIYDVLGREVATLASQEMGAGSYTADFNAANLAGGLYLCRLTSGSFHATMKMNLVK